MRRGLRGGLDARRLRDGSVIENVALRSDDGLRAGEAAVGVDVGEDRHHAVVEPVAERGGALARGAPGPRGLADGGPKVLHGGGVDPPEHAEAVGNVPGVKSREHLLASHAAHLTAVRADGAIGLWSYGGWALVRWTAGPD